MKKKIVIIIISILIIIGIIIGVIFATRNVNNNLNIASVNDMGNFIDDLYTGLTLQTSLNSMELDINNMDLVKSYTGLDNTEGIEHIVVSESMISTEAYSLILVKCENEERASQIASEMSENISLSDKWISASDIKTYYATNGDLVFLVMSNDDWAKPVYDKFVELSNN